MVGSTYPGFNVPVNGELENKNKSCQVCQVDGSSTKDTTTKSAITMTPGGPLRVPGFIRSYCPLLPHSKDNFVVFDSSGPEMSRRSWNDGIDLKLWPLVTKRKLLVKLDSNPLVAVVAIFLWKPTTMLCTYTDIMHLN